MGLVSELRRRNVLRMAVLYAIAAWLIMQVAELVVTLAALPDWSGQAVLVLLVIGFPISLIFSWFYELTPEGLSLEKDVAPGESITHITGRRMDFIVISLLSAAVLLFAWHTWWPSTPQDKSIAVLAFENMSDDPEQEYFSDGISEELLNTLAQVPELRVISRSSSFSFKDTDVDIPTVAKQLNVAHILEGSVRKMGNRVRITAQLIEVSTDSHLWSDTYDRDLDDIFAVQREISAAISMALKKRLGLQAEPLSAVTPPANNEAHDAYLKGRYLVVQRTRATIEGAIREFEKAIAVDPDYALAHAELAIATLLMNNYGGLPVTESVDRATPNVERAVALEPTLAEVHAATGLLSWNQYNLEEALTHFEQAIQINPNYAIVYNWMAIILEDRLGRFKEALPLREMAVRLDPLSIPSRSNYVNILVSMNRLPEAERELEKLASISPRSYAIRRAEITFLGGNWAGAALVYLDALQVGPRHGIARRGLALLFAIIGLETEALTIHDGPMPHVLTMLGRTEDAVAAAEARFAEEPTHRTARHRLALALAGAGDYARARPILEEMWQLSGGRVTCCGLFYEVSAAALIAKGADDGFFIAPNEAYLQAIYDDPGFAPIRESQEARQARERKKFLDIVCTDNPYADFWNPAAGTCKRFAAAGGK